MTDSHYLDVLFLTNFSDYCYRAIPAVAQMADAVQMRLTILHAYDPARKSHAEADLQVHSFYPEADHYANCRRVAVGAPLLEAVRRHVAMWPVNLIVAPASDPIGLPQLGVRSTRSRLIEQFGIPIWTMGRRVRQQKLVQPVRNVACRIDFHSDDAAHLPFAIDLAHKMGAGLHLLREIPDIHEGSLIPAVHRDKAFHPTVAAEEIRRLCVDSPVRPEVHVAMGHGRSALNRLLKQCNADVVFMRNQESTISKWVGLKSSMGSGIHCPAVYVGDKIRVSPWNLQSGVAHRASTARFRTWGAELGLG